MHMRSFDSSNILIRPIFIFFVSCFMHWEQSIRATKISLNNIFENIENYANQGLQETSLALALAASSLLVTNDFANFNQTCTVII